LWEQKFLPEKLLRHAKRDNKIAEMNERIREELSRPSWLEERRAAMAERVQRLRESLEKKK
jgi:aspartate/glutamate racemase